MRLLIIDNTIDPDSWGTSDLRRFGRLIPGATVHVRRAPQQDLPSDPASYDRIIISGSKTSAMEDAPWISGLHEFVRRGIDLGKPFLGVCYGHQTLVRAFGGLQNVRKGESAEFGWTRIQITEPSDLMKGMPQSFYSFSAHFEEVCSLPPAFRKLAKSSACEIQACQLEDRPVYGIQFHPERDIEGAKKTFAERKKKGTPKDLLHPSESEKLFDEKVGETLFQNFFNL